MSLMPPLKTRSNGLVGIASLAQIRALASPVRQEIVDGLSAMGPVSISTLARTLGRSPNALYFHIRKLEKLGLVVSRDNPGARGRPSQVYDVPGRPMALAYRPGEPKTREPMAKLVRSMTSSATRSFIKAYRPEIAVVKGFERNLWASRSKRHLSQREIEVVNHHLRALVALLNQSDIGRAGKRQLMELTFVLAPAAEHVRSRRRSRS